MGIAQRLPDGSVTFAAPDAATGAAPPASLGGGPTPSTHVVQRQEETEQRGAQATEPAAGEAGLTEPEPSPAESLASQAMKMYPIIARQLRMELSRERDRHGNRSGFGH
jgi:hypothetical protein